MGIDQRTRMDPTKWSAHHGGVAAAILRNGTLTPPRRKRLQVHSRSSMTGKLSIDDVQSVHKGPFTCAVLPCCDNEHMEKTYDSFQNRRASASSRQTWPQSRDRLPDNPPQSATAKLFIALQQNSKMDPDVLASVFNCETEETDFSEFRTVFVAYKNEVIQMAIVRNHDGVMIDGNSERIMEIFIASSANTSVTNAAGHNCLQAYLRLIAAECEAKAIILCCEPSMASVWEAREYEKAPESRRKQYQELLMEQFHWYALMQTVIMQSKVWRPKETLLKILKEHLTECENVVTRRRSVTAEKIWASISGGDDVTSTSSTNAGTTEVLNNILQAPLYPPALALSSTPSIGWPASCQPLDIDPEAEAGSRRKTVRAHGGSLTALSTAPDWREAVQEMKRSELIVQSDQLSEQEVVPLSPSPPPRQRRITKKQVTAFEWNPVRKSQMFEKEKALSQAKSVWSSLFALFDVSAGCAGLRGALSEQPTPA